LTTTRVVAPRVLIFGSCVSRDILNFAGNGSVTLVDYFARSSIASLASEPYLLADDHYARITSDFQRRMVRRDLEKTFLLELVRRRDFDFIVIDLIDERFDLYEVSPGSIVTVSSEFLMTGLVKPSDRSSEQWIRSGTERHRELWKSGVSHLFSLLAEHGLVERVIINKVFWAERMEDGTPLPAKHENQREEANKLLTWMYHELAQYVPERRWMTFAEDVLRANPDHRWGIAAFHYSDGYYKSAIEQLTKIYLETRRDGASLLPDGRIFAWSGQGDCFAHRTLFLIFRDEALLHKQGYSMATELQFDTKHEPGRYEVVISRLVFEPVERNQQPPQRPRSRFSFYIDRAS